MITSVCMELEAVPLRLVEVMGSKSKGMLRSWMSSGESIDGTTHQEKTNVEGMMQQQPEISRSISISF